MEMPRRLMVVLAAIVLLSCAGGRKKQVGDLIEVDICVYGGTSAGVTAAVQAARMGKRVVLVEPGFHLGGMTSGGLSWTDVGNSDHVAAVGGLAREVYRRIGAYYGRSDFIFSVQSAEQLEGGIDFQKPSELAFEPHVAETIFEELIAEAGVDVHFGAHVIAVRVKGDELQEMVTSERSSYRAKIFIDATYEGDLMAAAGISHTVGREANSTYNETLNGIQPPAINPRAGKFEEAVDPYVEPGNPASGLLPYLLTDESYGSIGDADNRIQAYNYRVCLTDNTDNMRPLAAPEGYDASRYELLARWIEARLAAGEELTLRDFLKYDPLPNNKFDFNNRWPVSTDYVGGSQEYPRADPAKREIIAKAHEDYLRGFFHFLRTNQRVPEHIRTEMARFGLPADEFVDDGGWPHQIYVREARRMVSDFVMTERHSRGDEVAPRSIALAAYGIDLHAARRFVHEGQPVNEGTIGAAVPQPYPIAYDAIIPKAKESKNLLVPVCLSASHVAFGSIRMEPVFMALGQSAAVAAALSIDTRKSVQRVGYEALRERLLDAGQVLNWD
jgi:FAD-dependent oxidoreductase family protein